MRTIKRFAYMPILFIIVISLFIAISAPLPGLIVGVVVSLLFSFLIDRERRSSGR